MTGRNLEELESLKDWGIQMEEQTDVGARVGKARAAYVGLGKLWKP